MNQRASAPIGILDEHPDWSDRLVAELTRRRLPWERIDHSNHAFDPRDHSPAYSVVVNRTSPSSHTRAHAGVLFYAEPLLTHYESLGVPVVNPVAAYRFEKSKALQLGLFERLGVRYPRAVVVNHRDQVRKALDRVRFPLVVKPNVGGSGAGIVRFAAREELEIESMMRTVAGVGQIHDLHVWTLTSGKYAMSGDVVVVAAPGDRILPELHALLHERFDIDHTTIQLESEPLVQIAARKSPSVFSSSPQRTVDHGEQQQKRGPLMHWPGREATRSPGVASARRPWLVLMLILTILVPSQAMAEPRLIDLPVRERLLPRDQRVIRVQQGDDVTLRWTTNHELKVHLHGYDIEKTLKPGETATMTFHARAAGRFPITVHSTDAGPASAAPGREGKEAVLGYLEVQPR